MKKIYDWIKAKLNIRSVSGCNRMDIEILSIDNKIKKNNSEIGRATLNLQKDIIRMKYAMYNFIGRSKGGYFS